MKVYTRKIIILVHTYRKNCTHKNLVCILDYGWWGVFTEFCSDSTAVCLYLVDESKTTTTNPDETSFLLIFYICSRLLKEFFLIWRNRDITHTTHVYSSSVPSFFSSEVSTTSSGVGLASSTGFSIVSASSVFTSSLVSVSFAGSSAGVSTLASSVLTSSVVLVSFFSSSSDFSGVFFLILSGRGCGIFIFFLVFCTFFGFFIF